MARRPLALALALLPGLAAPALAEGAVAARILKAKAVIRATDIEIGDDPAAALPPEAVVGREARVTIYKGDAIRPEDLAAPALIERNQVVILRFAAGPLRIETEGRALARAGAGEPVRVMNLASRATVTGTVLPDGSVGVAAAN